jgi:hypothetical protein
VLLASFERARAFFLAVGPRLGFFRCGIRTATSFIESAGPQSPAARKPSGTSTGGAPAPVKDAKSRPITAGGFVDGAPIVFLDITQQAGLDRFHHRSGSPEKSTILDVGRTHDFH